MIASRLRYLSKFASVAVCTLGLTLGLLSRAQATTVNWTGADNFNDGSITFTAFYANQLTDIFGSGEYEACCRHGVTSFELDLKLDGQWVKIFSWTATGDNTTHLLGDLVPPGFSFTAAMVSGIKLVSSPNGESGDPNYTDFKFTSYLTRDEYYSHHKSYYDERHMSYNDYVNCGDYEHYVSNVTSFAFAYVPTPHATPLPAAFPLFATGLGVMGLIAWRRKRKVSADIAAP